MLDTGGLDALSSARLGRVADPRAAAPNFLHPLVLRATFPRMRMGMRAREFTRSSGRRHGADTRGPVCGCAVVFGFETLTVLPRCGLLFRFSPRRRLIGVGLMQRLPPRAEMTCFPSCCFPRAGWQFRTASLVAGQDDSAREVIDRWVGDGCEQTRGAVDSYAVHGSLATSWLRALGPEGRVRGKGVVSASSLYKY